MFQIAGLTFHWYGLLLGLAIGVGWWLILRQAHRHKLNVSFLETSFIWLILGGLIGARLYHVITDWPRYQANIAAIFFIWQGGLSIIGAVMGGLVVLWWLVRRRADLKAQLGDYLDLSVFGLPLAQAVGRVGNYVNQELYGLPTQLPWKIFIDSAHRLPGYESVAYYHPLFAYEALALIFFAAGLWWWESHKHAVRLGTGRLFAVYVAYYALVRFGLDFLRLDTVRLPNIWLSINQVVMLVLLSLSLLFLVRTKAQNETK